MAIVLQPKVSGDGTQDSWAFEVTNSNNDFDSRVETLESELDDAETRLTDTETRLTSIEQKVTNFRVALQALPNLPTSATQGDLIIRINQILDAADRLNP